MSHATYQPTNSRSPDLGQRLLVNPRLLVHLLSQELFPSPTDYLTGWLMIRKCVAERLGCSTDTAGSLVDLLEGKGFLQYRMDPAHYASDTDGYWAFVTDPEHTGRMRRPAHRRAS